MKRTLKSRILCLVLLVSMIICFVPLWYVLGENGTAATCTTQAVCGECGVSFGNLAEHTKGAEATCTTAQVCSVCNEDVFQVELGHTNDYHEGKEATCTEAGTKTERCTKCGEETTRETETISHNLEIF